MSTSTSTPSSTSTAISSPTKVPNSRASQIKYVGKRPKHDQDNQCREKLCRLLKDAGCFHELCPEKLYLVYLAKGVDVEQFCEQHANQPENPFILWNGSQAPTLTYESFNKDFGPFNLAMTHLFCSQVKVWLDTQALRHPDKYIAIVLDDNNTKFKLNTTLLTAIAAMVLLQMTDEQVLTRLDFYMMHRPKLAAGESKKELVFREKKKFSDVSGHNSIMTVTLEDCIKAFYAALQENFYKYMEFDHTEYLFYETVISGDLNWVIPGKLLAFAGPRDKSVPIPDTLKHPPELYYPYFKDHNVTTIVRLNDPEYDKDDFIQAGFDHFDLYFHDGFPPTSTIALKFLKIVDEAKGAVAVHCYAGIGRTGTLIAAYLMARYNFTPQMAVAWTRICRPGSVIGEQQDWLFHNAELLSEPRQGLKDTLRLTAATLKSTTPTTRKNKKTSNATLKVTNHDEDAPVTTKLENLDDDNQPASTTYTDAEKTLGQAKALLLAKKQRKLGTANANAAATVRPTTRNAITLKNLEVDEGLTEDPNKSQKVAKQVNMVLDLGKTLPIKLYLSDLMQVKKGENPKFYRLKDNKYEWKVKFPDPGYVSLVHFRKNDVQAATNFNMQPERIHREPKLSFGYDKGLADTTSGCGDASNGNKLKPVVCYHLFP